MAVVSIHKKARLDYEVLDTFEAGMVLLGLEAKSVRAGRANLLGAHVGVRGGEAFVIGMDIPPYQALNTPKGYDQERARKLLLTRKEIDKLSGYEAKKGQTLIPLSIFTKGRNLKMEIGVMRGKKKFDKRETLKKKTHKRDMERVIKQGNYD